MSETLSLPKSLVARRQIRVSVHGLRELAADKFSSTKLPQVSTKQL
jgi:hypothetical protein